LQIGRQEGIYAQRYTAFLVFFNIVKWIEEVESLLKRYPLDLKPFQAIGYLEIIQHLHGGLNREAMTLRIQQRTRQYAKRQMTWFRKEPGFRWFAPENLSAAQQSIQEFLES